MLTKKHRLWTIALLILAVSLMACAPIQPIENVSAVPSTDVQVPSADTSDESGEFSLKYDTFEMQAQHIDQIYRMQVALPTRYAFDPEASFPVVYVTDADASFGTVAELAFLAETDRLDPIPPAILVGIGYDNPATWALNRTRDLSPEDTIADWLLAFQQQALGVPTTDGGADEFLDFIENELHLEILSRYRVKGDTAGLMSNSQGGLFSFYVFLNDSPLFDRYWIGSPNIFGPGTYLIDQLPARLQAGFDRPTRVYMSLGELERTQPTGSLPEEMHQLAAESYSAITMQMSQVDDTNFIFEAKEFEGETHNSVIPSAMNRAYRFLLRAQ